MRPNAATLKISYTPEELVLIILKSLPIRSVLDCKSVCKQFNNLIKDPFFSINYSHKSQVLFVTDHKLYCVLLSQNNGCHFPPVTGFNVPISFEIGSPCKLVSKPSSCVACVQGTNGRFVLCNLFTGSSSVAKILPQSLYSSNSWKCFGFGYDRRDGGDYKIVVAYDDGSELMNKNRMSQFWMYGFKSQKWTQLEGFPCHAYKCVRRSRNRACYLNGVFHWIVNKNVQGKNRNLVVTYDIDAHKFEEVLIEGRDHVRDGDLSELDGYMCCSWSDEEAFYVWVMKEYGVKESWTAMFRIDRWSINRKQMSNTIVLLDSYEQQDGRKVVLCACEYYGSLYWCDVNTGEVKVSRKCKWQKTKALGGRS